MAKKQIEDDVLDVTLDIDNVDEVVIPMEDIVKSKTRKEVYSHIEKAENTKELISCLRNEKVIVRYIVKPNTNVSNQRHVLYGGMAETASRTFTVPMLKSGALVNVLTDSEKDFLEYYMGLEKNALSVYQKIRNLYDYT